MRGKLLRSVALITGLSLVFPVQAFSQTPAPPPTEQPEPTRYNEVQLDALLAPIALYPDTLLIQVLMASCYPLQAVDASRWLGDPANAALKDAQLDAALAKQSWDPSVKSLVPFPQVLAMLNSKLEWMQQLGYAFATQEADVMSSVQRLRRQAQVAGTLVTTEQQRVVIEREVIIIQPADPQVVYVPTYNPTVVYGAWPYPAYPPVYIPPPPGYAVIGAFATGLAFAAGVATVGSLWGWARPGWHGRPMYINAPRYNTINIHRPPLPPTGWRPPPGGGGGRPRRPPPGPVGRPGRPMPLPPNAIGRPSVTVPGNVVNPRPPLGGNAQRPPVVPPRPPAVTQRPPTVSPRPPTNVTRPPTTPARPSAPTTRLPGAFNGMNDGARAGQYGNRGAQSQNRPRPPVSPARPAPPAARPARPAVVPPAGGGGRVPANAHPPARTR